MAATTTGRPHAWLTRPCSVPGVSSRRGPASAGPAGVSSHPAGIVTGNRASCSPRGRLLQTEYEQILAGGGRIAGPAAEAILANAATLAPADIDWLKTNFFKTELELGRCLRLPQEGPCERDLYLRCSKFFTTTGHAPRLRARIKLEHTLVDDATARAGSVRWSGTPRPSGGSANCSTIWVNHTRSPARTLRRMARNEGWPSRHACRSRGKLSMNRRNPAT